MKNPNLGKALPKGRYTVGSARKEQVPLIILDSNQAEEEIKVTVFVQWMYALKNNKEPYLLDEAHFSFRMIHNGYLVDVPPTGQMAEVHRQLRNEAERQVKDSMEQRNAQEGRLHPSDADLRSMKRTTGE